MSAAWVLALSRLSVVDWLLSAGLWVGYGVVENQVMPYHPEIAVNQTTGVPIGLNYPLRTETVSTIELGLYSLLLPALVILASNIIRPRNRWQTLAETSAALCGLSLATSATLLLSAVLKVTVGHPRPSFADRCGWNNSTRTCTASFDDIKEAYSSFPSSHASLAFSGLVYLILALAYIWLPRKITSPYEDPEAPQSPRSSDRTLAATETYVSSFQAVRARWYSTLVSALFVSPLCLACYISVTRVVENMHFTQDILAGAIIGTGLAFWAAGCKLTGVWVTLIQSGMGLGSRETEFHLDRFAI